MIATETSFLYIEDHRASRRVMELLLVEVMGCANLTMVEDTHDIVQKLQRAAQSAVLIVDLRIDMAPICGSDDGCGWLIVLLRPATKFNIRRNEFGIDLRRREWE